MTSDSGDNQIPSPSADSGVRTGSAALFTGLSAFPLTPVTDGAAGGVDESAYTNLITRLVDAGVDSVTALGSTGSYAYLNRDERRRVVELAVAAAGDVPVFAGIGSTRTRDVLQHAHDAQAAGAAALLLAPVSYQPLTEDEVYGLFEEADAASSVPLVVYDNPGTTHVTFTDALHARIAQLPHVASIKIPPVDGGPAVIEQRVAGLRATVPADVTIGISGDPVAADALNAGCDAWYSVLAGTLPAPCRAIVSAAAAGNASYAVELSNQLTPLWELFASYGSYRVVSALAEELHLVGHPNLPRPVRGLDEAGRGRLRDAVATLRAAGILDPTPT
ncbi:dihydrodipicolinate synthase family protein [Ornithinicoccus halotolerans]|uniref:dihydrodipicolinate synthase family protein n=1 Tax=Ornithinicoccus halotolerans TaxID=1748220 RepID=UPI002B1F85FE|nr:dihydrodipicolinate synthase family protein [Ornithinicoccus halotolerans]